VCHQYRYHWVFKCFADALDGGIIIRIKILVAAHKNFPMPADKRLYLPVLVGAVRNYREGICYQRDDDGENISEKNPYYNELTAMYWAWKNLKDVDAIGLVHYRRYFGIKKGRELEKVLSLHEVMLLLDQAPVIVPKKRRYYIESNYSHYIHAHYKEPLDSMIGIIEQHYPEYKNSLDEVLSDNKAHMFNMFIMKKKEFDRYCSWLFGILFFLESKVDLTGYSTQEKRVYGYISELLLDVWIKKNNISIQECRWFQVGKRHLIRKACYFLLRKLGVVTGHSHL